MAAPTLAVFDLDGTLIDSDEALIAPFVALGVRRDDITFGHPIEVECTRLGFTVEQYVAHYDHAAAQPFAGVEELVGRLGRWAICSNKASSSARRELARLAWAPEAALFSDDFGGRAKELGPVLDALGAHAAEVLFVGDTEHDARCAAAVGCAFAWAGWNPRTASLSPSGVVLDRPLDVLDLLG